MSIKEQLKPLVWWENQETGVCSAESPMYKYVALLDSGDKYIATKQNISSGSAKVEMTGFSSMDEAVERCNEHHVGKMAQWVKPIDPFATLHFYKLENQNYTSMAHGKCRTYRIHELNHNDEIGVFVHILHGLGGGHSSMSFIDTDFKGLEQAQAWCQQNYDVYYKGLSDEEK